MLVRTALIYQESGRSLVSENVARIAASMKEVGLLSPILVKRAQHYRDGVLADCFDIVAGRHRFEAARRLGWTEIECTVVDLPELQIELAEIDENLMRENLSPAQAAAAITRRKEIYETLHPETTKEAFKGNRYTGAVASDKLSFAKETAKATGKNKRSVERAAERGEALKAHLADIAGTSLDKGVELDALAEMPEDERGPLIAAAKAGENVSARSSAASAPELAAPSEDDERAADERAFKRAKKEIEVLLAKLRPGARMLLRDWLKTI